MGIESGVKGYLIGACEVSVGFPIDYKDKYHLACKYCKFLISSRRCNLTDEVVAFPESYIGNQCPFSFKELDYEDNKEDK